MKVMLSKTSRISVEGDQWNWYRIKSLELVLNKTNKNSVEENQWN